MSNTQSNDLLIELNAKLLAEIAKLRKKFAEIKVENDELKDKNAEIIAFSDKIAELETERTELKARIVKLLRQTVEESKWCDAENARHDDAIAELKAELDNASEVSFKSKIQFSCTSKQKKLENKDTDISWIQHIKKRLGTKTSLSVKGEQELVQELFIEPSLQESNIIQNYVIEISENDGPRKFNIDKALQHLAQLCDKAFDAENGANKANQEEILYWPIYGKDFRVHFNEIIKNSKGKIGEKKNINTDNAGHQISFEDTEISETSSPGKISSKTESGNITTSSIPMSRTSSFVTASNNSEDKIIEEVKSLPETETK
ncbi:14518_t:CDS:2, partial [Cetraspora pellucida]